MEQATANVRDHLNYFRPNKHPLFYRIRKLYFRFRSARSPNHDAEGTHDHVAKELPFVVSQDDALMFAATVVHAAILRHWHDDHWLAPLE
jgi:hypothetical protein